MVASESPFSIKLPFLIDCVHKNSNEFLFDTLFVDLSQLASLWKLGFKVTLKLLSLFFLIVVKGRNFHFASNVTLPK